MNGIFTVMWKEIRDNLRDRRSLFFAFFYGPLLMPALMMGPLVFNVSKHLQDYDTGKTVHVYGGKTAPNLIRYLKSRNLDAKEVGAGFQQRIKDGDLNLVLEISDTYGGKLLAGEPAKLILHLLEDDQDSRNFYWQVRGELDNYGRSIAAQRMMIRGFDQHLLQPIDIVKNNLSDDEFGSSIVATNIIFLVVFACMMGGLYLAIDITPGERERNSLEPLLSLPLTRTQILLGKFFSVFSFCFVSYLLPIISAGIWVSFLPDTFFGNADIPTVFTYLKITLLMAPVCLLFASALMALAAYSKSVKEAQTQMGIAMMIPIAPFIILQFVNVKSDAIVSAVPILSHYLLADRIMMDATYPLASMVPGALSSLVMAALLLAVSVYLYHRDEIL